MPASNRALSAAMFLCALALAGAALPPLSAAAQTAASDVKVNDAKTDAAKTDGLKAADPKPALVHVAQNDPKAEEIKRALAEIKLPQGFRIALFALAPNARDMAVGPRGEAVFVGTRATKLYAIAIHGGRADDVTEFAAATPMEMPHGVCFAKDGTLYLAEQNRVLAFPRAESATQDPYAASKTIVAQGELIPPEEETYNHSTRVCRIGLDDKLYISLGQPFNVPPKKKTALYAQWGIGGIIGMSRNGENREIFARGLRNSVGMDFNPKDGTLWFTDNQADRMGDDVPPGELNRATKAGQNFGFPWYGGGHTRTEDYKDETPPEGLAFPEVEMIAHAADLGMTFYHGAQFPEKYRGGIFSAQHGSWNRTIPVGARVMFTSLKPDGTADKTEPFAEGWLRPDGSYSGRPVDVVELPDGSLLVSDDFNGAVYRITYGNK